MQKMVNIGTEVVDGFRNKTLVFSASRFGNMEVSLTRLIVVPVPPILDSRATVWR